MLHQRNHWHTVFKKLDEKGKGKYILENVKIGENLYSICGDKYFIEDDIVPIFEDVLNDKIQLNEEENIEYRFHLFLVSMPASIVRALTLTMTNKENIRQQKTQRSFHYATDEEQKKIASSFWILWNKNISIPELLSCCFPSLFSPEEIQIIQNKYMEFEKKEDFTIGLIRTMMPFYKIISIRSSKAAV